MRVDIDDDDDETDGPELITDPMIKRYGHKLYLLTRELIDETEHYQLNREQINQLIDSLQTIRNLLIMAEDLTRLDALLRMSFPMEYYGENESMIDMLTNFPLASTN